MGEKFAIESFVDMHIGLIYGGDLRKSLYFASIIWYVFIDDGQLAQVCFGILLLLFHQVDGREVRDRDFYRYGYWADLL